ITRLKILVVDDDRIQRATARRLLEDAGFEVDEAPDGASGLAQIRTAPRYSLVVLDFTMPGLDGLEVLQQLRTDTATEVLPVLVHANDHNAYAHTLARCYVATDARRWRARAERLLAELAVLPGEPGWFTDTYCVRSRYLKPENGARVDAIRSRIAALALEPELEAIAITSLIEAADRVDSTVGVQMAYLKRWATRAQNPLRLRLPEPL